MTPFTKEYIEKLNWKIFADNEGIIWYSGRFELTYYKEENQFYLHIDDNNMCTIGDTKIEYVEEFLLYIKLYADSVYNRIFKGEEFLKEKMKYDKFIEVPEDYEFLLDPSNKPYCMAPDADIILLYDNSVDEVEFMFHNLRTEVMIQNDSQFDELYRFYKNFK